VQVRPARADDVRRVAEIERRSFGDPWSLASFADLVDDPRVLFLVVEADGAVAGYSVVWTAVDESELANLAVAPEHRGRGLGALLLDAAIAAARGRNADVMFLEVRESNRVAQALYASRGFRQVGRRRRYYRHPAEDALVLRAPLAPGAASSGAGAG
jgi:ribosomal-protein-alanine N-acetyltransferase